ncbi:hypothetical protein [Ruminiclostridium josui]|uniref:hypothetical protein n=1 Tax=Ruminiclostridium josui TaxID=1499 RepID=UPI0006CF6091|nr:hypothetical protein [Ruminiclostridium josui]
MSVFGKGDVWLTSVNPIGVTGGTFKNGEFTLLDLAIVARHLGEEPLSLQQYNTDIVMTRAIDEDDLTEIARYMLLNPI